MPQLLALNSRPVSRIQLLLALAAVTVPTMSGVARAAVFTWDNSAGTSQWSTATNWAGNVEPDATANVIFPTGFPVNVTLSSGETASRLQFDGSYMLSGGSLTLGAVDEIEVAAGELASINTPLTISNAMTKNGTGTLVLGGSNSNPSGFTVGAGTLRIANPLSLHQDSTSQPTKVNGGASLELAAVGISQRLTLMNGATLAARGGGTTHNITTLDAAASTVNLKTFASGDRLNLGDSSNEFTGGSASTVVNVSGPGTVRVNEVNDYDGSWSIGSGSRVELGRATSLGDNSLAGVTLAGGTLAGRSGSSLNFGVSPGNHLAITANSAMVADSIGAVSTISYQFGTVTMGSQTLAISGGASVTDGGRIDLVKTELSGDPSFDVQGATTLTIGSVTGGATPRQISKTGSGNLWVSGGSSDLAAGSSFSGTGSISLRYPALGAGATVVTTAAQNPFGNALLSISGGVLQLIPDSGTASGAQTYVLPGALSVAGDVTLDTSLPGNGIPLYKTYEFPSLSMAGGSTLRVNSANANRLRISGSLVLQGDATLRGSATPGTSSTLTLAGGIQGNSALTIGTSAVPFTLALNASSSRSGSTIIQDGDITLNAANAFGTGPLTLSGGMLTANVAGAIPGNVTLTAGTLFSTVDDGVSGSVELQGGVVQVRDTDAFDSAAFQLNGGTLDLRSESSALFQTGGVSVSGSSTISVSNLIGGGSPGIVRTLTLPLITGSPNATLNIASGGSYILQMDELLINGDFAISVPMGATGKIQTVSEGPGGPWTLTKLGGGILQLAGPTLRAGDTAVEGGTLQVSNSDALGSGTLVLGNVASTAAATASFDKDLTVPNAIVTSLPPAGGGTVKLASPTGEVNLTGPVLVQRELTLENPHSSNPSSLSGKIEGPGLITKTGVGRFYLSHPENEFTGGLKIQSGYLSVFEDASLGSSAVPIQLAGGYLEIAQSFSSNRTLALSGVANTGVAVEEGDEFTFGGQITGTTKFVKTGDGTMTFLPGVDNSARGNAATEVKDGSLRIQGLNNLSANGPIQVSSNNIEQGRAEFLADADTVYPYPVIGSGGIIHVDRSLTGSTVNGRHTLGPVTFSTNSYMRVTGGHGYGLSLGHVSALSGGSLSNQAEAPLLVDSVEGRTSALGFAGPGEIRILGGLTKQAGGDNFSLRLYNAPLKLGTSTAGFIGPVFLEYESVLDTNNLSLNATSVFFEGNWEATEPPDVGSRIEMGSGTLNLLSGGLYLYSQAMPGQVTGHVDLGNATRNFISAPTDSGGGVNQPGDAILTVDGPISGSGTAGITKSGGSILRMTGAGNTFPGALKVTAGEVQLGKSSGLAVGAGGLQVDMLSGAFTTGVTLLADEQIEDSVPLSLSGVAPNPDYYYIPRNAFLDLGNHTESVGPLSLSFSGGMGSTQAKIGPEGKLVLNGNLSFLNNIIVPTGGFDVAISGTGTLDLGGAVRTVDVSSTAPAGPEKDQKNATIEAKVVNGGIVKTGKQTLFLTNPANQFPLGITVQEGFIGPGAAGSLGSSPVTFTNGPGVLAGYDFGMATGVLAGNLTIGGTGDTEIRHSGVSTDTVGNAELTGNVTLEKDLVVNVARGPGSNGEGLLQLMGVISDGPSTFGLIKKGSGILKLGAANAYSGTTTVQRGSLWITGPGSLGDGNAPLSIDGGGLMVADSSVVLPRDINFTANGGSLRSTYYGAEPQTPIFELTGHVDWGSGTTGSYGVGGTTILSGTTAGTGNFQLGVPGHMDVSAMPYYISGGHCLSLRGPAALPSGNLLISKSAVLELGNGDFTRELGTGPGQVQIPGSGGWAAYGADRTVNIGGAGAGLTWMQTNPPFLAEQEGVHTSPGDLVLGSSTATHTVDFVNPLTVATYYPEVVTLDGAAAIDGRISGDLTLDSGEPEQPSLLGLYGDGTLEITGDLRGDFDIYQEWEGTTIFSGANEAQEMAVFVAKWIFDTPESLGTPRYFTVYASEVDVSALPGGLVMHPEGYLDLYGEITGDVTAPAEMYGSGTISGDLSTSADTLLLPEMYEVLAVGGDFSLAEGATLRFEFPDYLYAGESIYGLSVGGTVSLQGSLEMAGVGDYFVSGQTYILIANAGDDAIQGTFENLPEGAVIPMGDGYGMMVSYQANGDGGAVANDFGVTVIPLAGSADGRLTASAPVSVLPGEEIAIRYTLFNGGEGATTGTEFEAVLPQGLTFIGSQPAGVWDAETSTFRLELPDQEVGSTEDLVVRFNAPALTVPGTVSVAASYLGTSSGAGPAQVSTLTAVFPGGRPPVPAISHHPEAAAEEQFQISFQTLEGVRYVYEGSMDLQNWYQIGFVEGDGEPYTAPYPYYPEYQSQGFFRFRVVPALPVEEEEGE